MPRRASARGCRSLAGGAKGSLAAPGMSAGISIFTLSRSIFSTLSRETMPGKAMIRPTMMIWMITKGTAPQ